MIEEDMRRANETACERGIEEDMRRANETACERGAGRHAKAIEEAERREMRDWFAAAAISGLGFAVLDHVVDMQALARCSYALADAMLAARDGGR